MEIQVTEYDESGNAISCKIYDTNGDLQYREDKEYDSDGNCIKVIDYGSDNKKQREKYYSNGNMKKKISYGEGEVIEEISEFREDETILRYVFYYPDGSQRQIIEYYEDEIKKTDTTYLEDGRIYIEEYDTNGDPLRYIDKYDLSDGTGRVEIVGDKVNNTISRKEFHNDNTCTEVFTYEDTHIDITREFDENGIIIEEIVCEDYVLTERRLYNEDGIKTAAEKYDENGEIEEYIYYQPDGTVDYLDEVIERDAESRVKKMISYNGDKESVSYTTFYEYDSTGYMKKEVYTPNNYEIINKYDNNDNMVEVIYQDSDGNKDFWNQYIYDANGSLIETIDMLT